MKAKPYSEAEVLKLARSCIQALKPYVPGRSIEDMRAQYNLKVLMAMPKVG